MMARTRTTLLLLAAVLPVACSSGPSDREAVALVRRYLEVTADAFRTGDAQGVSRVAAFQEFKKVSALVGAKVDAGMTMDAVLLELTVEKVERGGGGRQPSVVTRERWSWRDLRIGTGEQIGPESRDSYHVRYQLVPFEKGWVVGKLEFVDPPQVGRKEGPPPIPASAFH
jgi:hypothetical protein